MKQIFILLICLFPQLVFAQNQWWQNTVRSDLSSFYYVGISDGQSNLQKAMTESYNEALKEAVKHQFGFNQKFVESFYSTLTSSELNQELFLKQDDIEIRGVRPGRHKVSKTNGKYLVYREIIYSRNAVGREKKRLLLLKQKIKPIQKYSISGSNIGKLHLRSIPDRPR